MTAYPDTLACVCCQAELPNIMATCGIQPSGGLAFSSSGHFGSTVFDPMDGSSIQIVVCDPCLAKRGWYPADRPRRDRSRAPVETGGLSQDFIAALERGIAQDEETVRSAEET